MKRLLRNCGCGSKDGIDGIDGIDDDTWYLSSREDQLETELNQLSELKYNRLDTKSRILGIDEQSNQLRDILDSQILELSLKIDKLCGGLGKANYKNGSTN